MLIHHQHKRRMRRFGALARDKKLAEREAARISGEIAAGTMDLLLTHPVRRSAVVTANAAVLLITAVVLPLVLFAGHNLGLALFPLPIEDYAGRFLPVVVNAILFGIFTGGLALLVSAAASVRGRAVGIMVTLIGVFLFVDLGAGIWSKIAWLDYFTPFGYFEPARIVALDRFFAGDLIGLAVGATALYGATFLIFTRRQIP